jgi:hypothetical protein
MMWTSWCGVSKRRANDLRDADKIAGEAHNTRRLALYYDI